MKIVSWNVNGLRAIHKKGNWDEFLAKVQPDIFGLQETKSTPDQLPAEVRELPGFSSSFSSSEVKKGYSGVALYSKETPLSVIHGMGDTEFDCEGRLVGAEFNDFWLLNVYFPNGGQGPHRLDFKMRYYDEFLSFCEKLRVTKPVIFCGDVNTAHEEIDLARPKENQKTTGFLPSERAWIDEVQNTGYIDVFRYLHPNKAESYTYWDTITRARDRNVGWRIDYFFVAQELLPRIKKAEIHTDIFGSDHCPVSITL